MRRPENGNKKKDFNETLDGLISDTETLLTGLREVKEQVRLEKTSITPQGYKIKTRLDTDNIKISGMKKFPHLDRGEVIGGCKYRRIYSNPMKVLSKRIRRFRAKNVISEFRPFYPNENDTSLRQTIEIYAEYAINRGWMKTVGKNKKKNLDYVFIQDKKPKFFAKQRTLDEVSHTDEYDPVEFPKAKKVGLPLGRVLGNCRGRSICENPMRVLVTKTKRSFHTEDFMNEFKRFYPKEEGENDCSVRKTVGEYVFFAEYTELLRRKGNAGRNVAYFSTVAILSDQSLTREFDKIKSRKIVITTTRKRIPKIRRAFPL